jgi:hypothetical protein
MKKGQRWGVGEVRTRARVPQWCGVSQARAASVSWCHNRARIRRGASMQCKYTDGGRYKGQWRADTRHGQGECVFADGSVYVGGWAADAMHGTGTWTASATVPEAPSPRPVRVKQTARGAPASAFAGASANDVVAPIFGPC